MSRLTGLIAQAEAKGPQTGADPEREFKGRRTCRGRRNSLLDTHLPHTGRAGGPHRGARPRGSDAVLNNEPVLRGIIEFTAIVDKLR
jgi:hypothetical protein